MKRYIAIIAMLGLAACGGSKGNSAGGSNEPSFGSSNDVVSVLQSDGIPCDNENPASTSKFGVNPTSATECTMQSSIYTVYVFGSHSDLKNYIGVGKTLGCSMLKGLGISNYSYVSGGNWLIEVDQSSTADTIGAKMGNVTHANC